jgi:hypothetical protein
VRSEAGPIGNTPLLVSHDRVILNGVAAHILHLENQKLTLYPGSHDNFVRVRRERLARQAQSRIKAPARLEPIATPAEDSSMSFVFPQPEELRPPLLAFDTVAVGYESGKPILRGIDLRLNPDDRIAQFEDHRRQLASDRNAAATSRMEKPEANSRQTERRDAAKRRQDLAPLRKKAAEAAKRVEQLTKEKQEAERVLADPAIDGNGADVTALLRRAELAQALSEAEELWLAAEEAVESAAAMAG